MANPKHKLDREEIMSFLLGEMEEAETSRIEAMFLSDPSYSEAIEEAKSQLYQDYKSGRLTPQQSGRFEARVLPNLDEDKKKFQAMLDRNEERRRAGLDQVPPAPASRQSAATPTSSTPRAAPAKRGMLPIVVGALVLGLAGLAAAFFLNRGDDNPDTDARPVELSVFSVLGQSQLIVLPKQNLVVVHLPLPADESSGNYSIIAHHGDDETQWPARAVGAAVETRVRPSSLQVGRYDLELRRSDDTVVGYYSLRK